MRKPCTAPIGGLAHPSGPWLGALAWPPERCLQLSQTAMCQLAALLGQLPRALALTLLFLFYPVFVLPRVLWAAYQARRRLRTYGPPVVLAGGAAHRAIGQGVGLFGGVLRRA